MEWERAKNYILIFLVLLNAALGAVLFLESQRYTLSADHERNIFAVLAQNNINMYISPIRRFPPMRHLHISGFYYDEYALIAMLFPDPLQVVQIDAEFSQFEDAYSRLIISNGFVSYENLIPRTATNNLPPLEITDTFIMQNFPDFELDTVWRMPNDEGVRITYRQKYRDHFIYTNFVELLVHEGLIRMIDMQFGQVQGHSGTPRAIASSDEALLTFVQRVQFMAETEPWFITRMDIAYFQEYEISDQPGATYSVVPFYRIFVQGDDRAFLINAFTNTIID